MNRDNSRTNLGFHGVQGMQYFNVHLKGLPGFNQKDRFRRNEGFVRGADICIVEIGTNDLAEESKSHQELAKEHCEYVQSLQITDNLKTIIISQVLFRRVEPSENYNK